MNISKVKTAIAAARKELQNFVNEVVEAGKKDAKQFKSLPKLSAVDNALVKADEKLEAAAEAVAPKEKKEKAAKK